MNTSSIDETYSSDCDAIVYLVVTFILPGPSTLRYSSPSSQIDKNPNVARAFDGTMELLLTEYFAKSQ